MRTSDESKTIIVTVENLSREPVVFSASIDGKGRLLGYDARIVRSELTTFGPRAAHVHVDGACSMGTGCNQRLPTSRLARVVRFLQKLWRRR